MDRQVAERVFTAKLQGDEALIEGFSLDNGDYAVYRLRSVTPGDPQAATDEQRQEIARQLESRDGNSAYMLFNAALRKAADVEIFTSLLEDDSETLAAQ